MTEHVCEWEYAWVDSPAHHVFCCRCGEFLDDDDVEARLNATERLSAVAANGLLDLMATGIPSYLSSVWASWRDALQAYADILEGKDE